MSHCTSSALTAVLRVLKKRIKIPDSDARTARPTQPINDWFTEGFDTADLKEAKALLEELK